MVLHIPCVSGKLYEVFLSGTQTARCLLHICSRLPTKQPFEGRVRPCCFLLKTLLCLERSPPSSPVAPQSPLDLTLGHLSGTQFLGFTAHSLTLLATSASWSLEGPKQAPRPESLYQPPLMRLPAPPLAPGSLCSKVPCLCGLSDTPFVTHSSSPVTLPPCCPGCWSLPNVLTFLQLSTGLWSVSPSY